MKKAWILAIGTELTLGQTVDTNSAWLAQRLAMLGWRTVRHLTVADELSDICDAVTQAAGGADAVLITGGLGPTADDLTRQALATALSEELVLDPASLEQIHAFFAARRREMPDRNRCQAMRPESARALQNTCGTAPGLAASVFGTPCFALPGVPGEMRAMFDRDVAPTLESLHRGEVLLQRKLLTFGRGESDVGHDIADLMARGRNPEVGTTAAGGIVGVRINAAGHSLDEARRVLDEAEKEVRRRLGGIVFGADDDTLAIAVGRRLADRGQTLALAESCTGGMIAAHVTDVAGCSEYFLGGVVSYSNAAKQELLGVEEALLREHGAVSETVAVAMATGARRRFGSDYAVSVTGIAGPGGGTTEKPVGLVCLGLATAGAAQARTLHLGSDAPREVIRGRATGHVLNWLRLTLLELDESAG